MTDARRAELVRMLAEQQEHVLAKRRALREQHPVATRNVKDDAELCADALALGVDLAIAEKDSDTLRRIDEAITRVDAGTYGICASCEEPIAAARLQALPLAELCRDCQEEKEHAAAARAATPR